LLSSFYISGSKVDEVEKKRIKHTWDGENGTLLGKTSQTKSPASNANEAKRGHIIRDNAFLSF